MALARTRGFDGTVNQRHAALGGCACSFHLVAWACGESAQGAIARVRHTHCGAQPAAWSHLWAAIALAVARELLRIARSKKVERGGVGHCGTAE